MQVIDRVEPSSNLSGGDTTSFAWRAEIDADFIAMFLRFSSAVFKEMVRPTCHSPSVKWKHESVEMNDHIDNATKKVYPSKEAVKSWKSW